MKHVLVTGAAGFIGSHLVDALLHNGWKVTAVDNFDSFYARSIKESNIVKHLSNSRYEMLEIDIRDFDLLQAKLNSKFDVIVHLAAKAGVRPSIDNPTVYQEVNVRGTQNILEIARILKVPQFVFASSSSVYGVNPNTPWKESDHVLMPISPYASSKVSGELLGHVYSHLYDIRFIALRFFTVYGPRQRPDLAIHKFASLMKEDKDITLYGNGNSSRDYTFISDIVSGIVSAMTYSDQRYAVFNLGNSNVISLGEVISNLERSLGIEARRIFTHDQPGDVPITSADISSSMKHLNYKPSIDFSKGIDKFADWFVKI